MAIGTTSFLGFATNAWSPPSLAHALTVAGSVALHASLLCLDSGGRSRATVHAARLRPTEVVVEVEPGALPAAAVNEPGPSAPHPHPDAPAARASLIRRAAPIPASADAVVPAAAPIAVAEQSSSPAVAAPRFTLLETTRGAVTGSVNAGARPGVGTAENVVWEAHDVTEPARLLSSSDAVYPALATVAGVESDVVLELVLDETGRVTSARVQTRAGYGFDESALAAVRAYRFSPARRSGRSVRVRLSWTVHFRLR